MIARRLAAGDTRHQMLGLCAHGDVTLVVADTAVALADLIDFARGAYMLDAAAIRHLVDAATTADPRYTPSMTRREAHTLATQARYARWQAAYRALKQRRRGCPTCGTPGRLPSRQWRPATRRTLSADT